IAEGTAGHMVARLPDSEAIIPSLILMFLAYQKAEVPESAVKIHRSGSRGESSENNFCGLMGSATCSARCATVSHQSLTWCWISSCHDRSSLYCSKGISFCKVCWLLPSRFTSMG